MADVQSAVSGAARKSTVWTSLFFGLALAIFHGYLASIYIDHPPQYDEMYHMLAAESWRVSGELRILDGEYLRASLFTKMVGLNANNCGPSLECARGISVAASVLLVFFVTVFAGTVMRPAVGFIAGTLLALNPALVAVSQYVRFYSLHALILFVVAAILFIIVAYRRRIPFWQVLVLAGLAAVLLLLANHLQSLTQAGLLALLFGAAIVLAPDITKSLRQKSFWVASLLILTVFAVFALSIFVVDVESKIQSLRSAPGWAQVHKDNWLFYYQMLKKWYPVLWPMMAILAILSIAQWPRPSIYFLAAFTASLMVLSVAGTKASRLIVFALPFLFIPMAAGITTGLQLFIGFLQQRTGELLGWQTGHPMIAPLVGAIATGSLMLFLTTQPIARDLARIFTGTEAPKVFSAYSRVADWPEAADEIRAAIKDYPVVISSSGVKAAYYLGDFSFELNHSVMLETDTGAEFGLDRRTGRQVIGSMDSVISIIQECGPTLVIMEPRHSRQEEILLALDSLSERQTPAANVWVWRITPDDVETRDGDLGDLEGGSLNCRPVTLPRAR